MLLEANPVLCRGCLLRFREFSSEIEMLPALRCIMVNAARRNALKLGHLIQNIHFEPGGGVGRLPPPPLDALNYHLVGPNLSEL